VFPGDNGSHRRVWKSMGTTLQNGQQVDLVEKLILTGGKGEGGAKEPGGKATYYLRERAFG